MSHKSNHNRHRNRNGKPQNKEAPQMDETNSVIISFRQYAVELDDKHDRYERIVKLSRDITIESKRIIFLLHTIDPNKNNKEKILQEANNRLSNVITNKFLEIAKELENRDPYQYLRAYCAGLQEFIEAYSYCEYLSGSELSDWKDLQEKMIFTVPAAQSEVADESAEIPDKKLPCLVEPTEYILGLADLTGELMRRCINSLGSGDTQTCFESCKVLQDFYKGYMGLHGVRNREFGKKVYTMHQSVLKAEHVCYNVKVRGGEAARRGTVGDDKPEDLDEGFYLSRCCRECLRKEEDAVELDDKHDRYERIVKLSRDITIESKRIIFLLHTIDPNKNNKEKILQEANNRLSNVITNKFLEIAKELENRDPYQYLRAYCAGLQEFIEAYSYCEYLSGSELSDWKDLQEKMIFTVPAAQSEVADESAEIPDKKLPCLVEPTEYILGLADLTGELMRRCINSLGSGDTQTCFESCKVLQDFYKGYMGLHGVRNREFGKKVYTMHQSVLKAEHVCYNVKVRGGEAARRGTVGDDKPEDLDEGFY